MESAQRQQQPPSSKARSRSLAACHGRRRTDVELCPALTKTTHATLARGRGIVAFGLRQRSALPVTSRARAHDMLAARASPARRPPRGAVSLPTAIMPLAVSLLHVTCGVACRPWGCSIGRQPMLRYATTTHRLHCCSQPCRVGGMLVHTHTTPGARESARVPHTYSYHTFHLIRVGRAGFTKTTRSTLARLAASCVWLVATCPL